jgi:hypothetical protein
MNNFYYNDWCTYDNNVLSVNDYDQYELDSVNFNDVLQMQANKINCAHNNYVVFISGGIDSQTKALGFILARIDVDFVILKHTYNSKSNDLEIFYAQQFCNKHNVKLTIYEIKYTRVDLEELILEQEFLTTPVGSGALFQFDGMRKYISETGKKIVTSHGHFSMRRVNQICSGYFWKPNTGILHGLDMDNIIVFDMYAPYIYKYYEHMHRTTPEIQILPEYEAKNLSYTVLNLPFRPKLSGYEFLCGKDYTTLSTVDWADDHSKKARLANGVETILNASGISDISQIVINKPKYSPVNDYVKLYEFKSNHQFP